MLQVIINKLRVCFCDIKLFLASCNTNTMENIRISSIKKAASSFLDMKSKNDPVQNQTELQSEYISETKEPNGYFQTNGSNESDKYGNKIRHFKLILLLKFNDKTYLIQLI